MAGRRWRWGLVSRGPGRRESKGNEKMARQQLIELHEQPWCPAVIRTGATDYLRFIATVARQYRHVVPLLDDALANCASSHIIDLCSGSGGPWAQLAPQLNALRATPVAVTLTDLYPDQAPPAELLPAYVRFAPMAVDATATSPPWASMIWRTM